MNEEIKKEILNKIKAYDSIVLSRHIRPDGDAVGSTLGLKKIIECSFPNKKVYIASCDKSEYMSFLGDEGASPSDEEIKSSLVIVIDTASSERISDKRVLNGKEIIKIDHHIDISPFGDISWVEDKRSSASEMIASFFITFKDELKINKDGATCIYAGMNTDSGRFKYESTTGETLRLAAAMLDYGVDIEWLQANLELKEYDFYRYQADVFSKINMTENGVAWLYVDKAMQEKWNLTKEMSSESISFMSAIKGAICWIAFIDSDDGTIRVRLRSRFMAINKVAEKYHGGGHDRASGATCYTKEEMMSLLDDADKEVKKFKEKGEYWI